MDEAIRIHIPVDDIIAMVLAEVEEAIGLIQRPSTPSCSAHVPALPGELMADRQAQAQPATA